MKKFWSLNKGKFLLLLIILLGAVLRLYNLDWDQGTHIHPDERFLTMVGGSMKLPATFSNYLNPDVSTFNPANVGYRFFVYGIFPLSLNKSLALIFNNDTYNAFTIQGRFLSALADLLVIFFIYKTVGILEKRYKIDSSIKYFSSFLYSIFVLPIQLSHFFAVDTFLNLFVFATFFFSLNYWTKRRVIFVFLSGIFFGLALASKITGACVVLLVIPFLAFEKERPRIRFSTFSLLHILLFLAASYLILRLTDPYIFTSSDILSFTPSELFIKNLHELRALGAKNSFYPPNVQWISKIALLFTLKNLIIFGIGIPAFAFFLLGIFCSLKTKAKLIILGILAWMTAFLLYQGNQVAVPMRYFILVYPFIAIITAFGINYVFKRFGIIYLVLSLVFISIWGLMFFSIYTKPHSRITASYWILRNVPQGGVILSEYWDDALPVFGGNYQSLQLPVFDSDTPEKWQKMNNFLSQGDYLILSSNRGWGSIPTVPERYPQMTKFYKDLFDNKLSYKKIEEFTSYPSLSYLRIPLTLPDQWADESFTVYDHPKVVIFKNEE